MKEFWRLFFQQLKPKFHEISMYLIALSFCWILLFHPEFLRGFLMFSTGFYSFSPYFMGLGLFVSAGIVLSLTHAFINRKKSALEKAIMGWAILGISGVASFVVGSEMLATGSSTMMVLVVWNILMSLLLLIQGGTQKFEIGDEDATLVEVVFTTALLLVILLIADLYLRLSWAMVLSICIFYATSIVFITTWAVNQFNLKLPAFLRKKAEDPAGKETPGPGTDGQPPA
jgi:hypothetical protein